MNGPTGNWCTRLGRIVVSWLLMLAFVGAPRIVHADPGRPVGWQLDTATERIVVGRIELRYDPKLADEAREVSEDLLQWWSDVEQALAHDLDDQMVVSLVTHPGRVADATGMPRWVNGVANPESGEVVVSQHTPDGALNDYVRTLKHELVHVGLYRATNGTALPRWFHEGVAESLTDEVSFARAEALAAAVFGAGVPELARIDRAFHGDKHQASVAYAAARDFVTYLRYRDGDATGFRRLLDELRRGHGFEASFIRAFDLSLEQVESEWRQGLVGRFVWYPLLASGTLPFMLFVPVGIAAWIRKRKLYREGLARLAAEEEAVRARRLGLIEGSRPHWFD